MNKDEQVMDFADELDALIESWRNKPFEDRLTMGDYVATLQYASHKLMTELVDWERTARPGEGND